MSKTGWSRFAIVGFIWGVPYLFLKIAVEEISPSVVVLGRVEGGIGAQVAAQVVAAAQAGGLPLGRHALNTKHPA